MDRDKLFQELLKRHSSLIRRVVKKYFPNSMDADDVFQDISIHVYKKLNDTPDRDLEKWLHSAWITTITKNKCLDFLKAKNRLSTKYKDTQDQNYFDHITSQISIYKSEDNHKVLLKTSVRQLLTGLRNRERTVIIMRFIKGYSTQEIAKTLNLTNASVYLRRALDKIKNLINGKDFFELFDGFDFSEDNEVEKLDEITQTNQKK